MIQIRPKFLFEKPVAEKRTFELLLPGTVSWRKLILDGVGKVPLRAGRLSILTIAMTVQVRIGSFGTSEGELAEPTLERSLQTRFFLQTQTRCQFVDTT